jgi:hypothetical protein
MLACTANIVFRNSAGLPVQPDLQPCHHRVHEWFDGALTLSKSIPAIIPERVDRVSADGIFVDFHIQDIFTPLIYCLCSNQPVDRTNMKTRSYKDCPSHENLKISPTLFGDRFHVNNLLGLNTRDDIGILKNIHSRTDPAFHPWPTRFKPAVLDVNGT